MNNLFWWTTVLNDVNIIDLSTFLSRFLPQLAHQALETVLVENNIHPRADLSQDADIEQALTCKSIVLKKMETRSLLATVLPDCYSGSLDSHVYQGFKFYTRLHTQPLSHTLGSRKDRTCVSICVYTIPIIGAFMAISA